MSGDFGKLIAQKRPSAANHFCNETGAILNSQFAPQPTLTISDIGVRQLLNPQSSQGFSPLREPSNAIVLR
jgi:hypothetical protein